MMLECTGVNGNQVMEIPKESKYFGVLERSRNSGTSGFGPSGTDPNTLEIFQKLKWGSCISIIALLSGDTLFSSSVSAFL